MESPKNGATSPTKLGEGSSKLSQSSNDLNNSNNSNNSNFGGGSSSPEQKERDKKNFTDKMQKHLSASYGYQTFHANTMLLERRQSRKRQNKRHTIKPLKQQPNLRNSDNFNVLRENQNKIGGSLICNPNSTDSNVEDSGSWSSGVDLSNLKATSIIMSSESAKIHKALTLINDLQASGEMKSERSKHPTIDGTLEYEEITEDSVSPAFEPKGDDGAGEDYYSAEVFSGAKPSNVEIPKPALIKTNSGLDNYELTLGRKQRSLSEKKPKPGGTLRNKTRSNSDASETGDGDSYQLYFDEALPASPNLAISKRSPGFSPDFMSEASFGATEDASDEPNFQIFVPTAEYKDEKNAKMGEQVEKLLQNKLNLMNSEFPYREWNAEFHEIKDRLIIHNYSGDKDKSYQAAKELNTLAADFTERATTIAKRIITELPLPNDQKTIWNCSGVVGGRAGGEKYFCGGIFFKFTLDFSDLYGGDQYAIKAAGHEMKGLTALIPYVHQRELNFPLLTLVDYMGYRVAASSVLPIDSTTLVYGSADGGTTVHNSDPQVDSCMKYVGEMLKISGHYVWSRSKTKSEPISSRHKAWIVGPGDLEGHRGSDGRIYFVDLARLFPPTTPVSYLKNPFLYQLFRPEYVKHYKIPLCSDGYCLWGNDPSDSKVLSKINRELDEATHNMVLHVVPACAALLLKTYRNTLPPKGIDKSRLCMYKVHLCGVNIRYLGLLYSYIRAGKEAWTIKKILLNEMLTRTISQICKAKMRREADENVYDSDSDEDSEEDDDSSEDYSGNESLGEQNRGFRLFVKRKMKDAMLHLVQKYVNRLFDTSNEVWETRINTTQTPGGDAPKPDVKLSPWEKLEVVLLAKFPIEYDRINPTSQEYLKVNRSPDAPIKEEYYRYENLRLEVVNDLRYLRSEHISNGGKSLLQRISWILGIQINHPTQYYQYCKARESVEMAQPATRSVSRGSANDYLPTFMGDRGPFLADGDLITLEPRTKRLFFISFQEAYVAHHQAKEILNEIKERRARKKMGKPKKGGLPTLELKKEAEEKLCLSSESYLECLEAKGENMFALHNWSMVLRDLAILRKEWCLPEDKFDSPMIDTGSDPNSPAESLEQPDQDPEESFDFSFQGSPEPGEEGVKEATRVISKIYESGDADFVEAPCVEGKLTRFLDHIENVKEKLTLEVVRAGGVTGEPQKRNILRVCYMNAFPPGGPHPNVWVTQTSGTSQKGAMELSRLGIRKLSLIGVPATSTSSPSDSGGTQRIRSNTGSPIAPDAGMIPRLERPPYNTSISEGGSSTSSSNNINNNGNNTAPQLSAREPPQLSSRDHYRPHSDTALPQYKSNGKEEKVYSVQNSSGQIVGHANKDFEKGRKNYRKKFFSLFSGGANKRKSSYSGSSGGVGGTSSSAISSSTIGPSGSKANRKSSTISNDGSRRKRRKSKPRSQTLLELSIEVKALANWQNPALKPVTTTDVYRMLDVYKITLNKSQAGGTTEEVYESVSNNQTSTGNNSARASISKGTGKGSSFNSISKASGSSPISTSAGRAKGEEDWKEVEDTLLSVNLDPQHFSDWETKPGAGTQWKAAKYKSPNSTESIPVSVYCHFEIKGFILERQRQDEDKQQQITLNNSSSDLSISRGNSSIRGKPSPTVEDASSFKCKSKLPNLSHPVLFDFFGMTFVSDVHLPGIVTKTQFSPDHFLERRIVSKRYPKSVGDHEKHKYVLIWTRKLAECVKYLFASGVEIQHLTSAEVLITDEGDIKIFHFSMLLRGADTSITGTGQDQGVAWLAPEVLIGGEGGNNDPRKTVVYSIGVLAWQLLTNKVPFEGVPFYWALMQIGNGKMTLEVPIGVEKNLKSVIEKCWYMADLRWTLDELYAELVRLEGKL